MTKKLSFVSFIEGICINVMVASDINYNDKKEERHFYVIGYLDNKTSFMLCYIGAGITQWYCKERIGDALRRKILENFKSEIRSNDVLPSYIKYYDFKEELSLLHNLAMDFINKIWEQKYSGKEPIIILDVPFEEKQEAQKLGAFWDGSIKKWCIEESKQAALSKWIK